MVFFMHFYKLGVLLLGLSLFGFSNVYAQPYSKSADASEVSEDEQARILSALKAARPDLTFKDVRPSPIPGVYKVSLNEGTLFVSASGEYLIAGDMYQINQGKMVNLQEEERRQQEVDFEPERARLLAAVNTDDMIVFKPEGEIKGHAYVFTDIDCGFCRRLHAQMSEFLDKGIEIRYLAFPRAGINSQSADKLATVWCSKEGERQKRMSEFKEGKKVAIKTCDSHPVGAQYLLGQEVGVRGTPAIVLSSGKLIPGAVSPDYLANEMGI